ncbi:MAG: tRNA lysidine(34) synthetase TilS [Panacagrimonas sp.]
MTPRVPLARILQPPSWFRDGRLIVGYSGGLDSTVLLHALARQGLPVQAVHVHHGLQAAADAWVQHAQRVCAELDLPLAVEYVTVRGDGQGVEAAARQARYAAFAAQLRADDLLVLAHHQDDQAETVLLNLVRGSGPAGLAAMRTLSQFKDGHRVWRPLLTVTRAELLDYAQAHRLRWIDDPHNDDPSFARSALRAQIMTRLRARWPAASRLMARAADLQAEVAELQAELALSDMGQVDAHEQSLSIGALLALSPARRRNLLRARIGQHGLPMPYLDTLCRVDSEVLHARVDAEPLLCWPGGEFRRYRDRLFVMARLPPIPAVFRVALPLSGSLDLPAGCGRVVVQGGSSQEANGALRLVQDGDRFRPPGSPQPRSLKTLFQSRSIPGWVRRRTPALEGPQGLLWIGGLGWSADRPPELAQLALHWRDAPVGALG